MVISVSSWGRQPGRVFRAAILTLIVAVLFLVPIYLQNQWAPAQVATAPWWVALVRIPFFAGIMMFTYYPTYWILLYALWILTGALLIFTLVAWRRSRQRLSATGAQERPATA
jgi:hypothetical protein